MIRSQHVTAAQHSRFRENKTQWLAGGITIALVLAALVAPLPVTGAVPQERHVTISAHSFAFEPATVHVHRGDTDYGSGRV